MGFRVNGDKKDRVGQNVTVGDNNFARVDNFKYLSALITEDNKNSVKEEQDDYIQNGYAFPLCYLTQEKAKDYLVFEREVFGKIYGAVRNTVTGQYRIRSNSELQILYNYPDIVKAIKAKRLQREGYIQK